MNQVSSVSLMYKIDHLLLLHMILVSEGELELYHFMDKEAFFVCRCETWLILVWVIKILNLHVIDGSYVWKGYNLTMEPLLLVIITNISKYIVV